MQPPPGTPTDVIGMDMGEGVPSDDMHGTHEQLRDSLRLSLLRTTCPLPAAAAPVSYTHLTLPTKRIV